MDLKETDILGTDIAKHWYYRSKAEAMKRMLGEWTPSRLLDVGAGSGFFSRHLLVHSPALGAWCVDISYNADSDATEACKPLYFRRSIESVNADLVLMMDVLEHVDDDVGLLKDYVSKVPSGARFLISVPAFQFLWSGHDDFLEHKRRYTLNQLKGVARCAGLKVKHSAYYFGMVFPIAATIRLAEKMSKWKNSAPRSHLTRHHPLVNGALTVLCQAELPFMTFNQLAGLTVFCLAEST